MSIKGHGSKTGTALEVETNTRAARVVMRPIDAIIGGSYSKSLVSGTIAAGLAANANVYHFRNTSPHILCVIKKVTVSSAVATVGFTAGATSLRLFPARMMTAVPTAGASATYSANASKLRTSMSASWMPSNRVSTGVTSLAGTMTIINTAALTTAGATLDTDPIAAITSAVQAAPNAVVVFGGRQVLYAKKNTDYPLICGEYEGFTIQATVPATGTWVLRIVTEWEEVPFYS